MNIAFSQKSALLTFRCHVGEPQQFENFLNLFLPMLNNSKILSYAYSIEKDDTPDKHIHCFFTHIFKDKSKINQYFNTKAFQLFKSSLHLTKWEHAWNLQYIKSNSEDDYLMALGYSMKDSVKRYSTKELHPQIISQAVKYYYANGNLKQKTISYDWIQLTPKNFHAYFEDYQKKHPDLPFKDIPLHMIANKYTFININPKAIEQALCEIYYQQNLNNPDVNTKDHFYAVAATIGSYVANRLDFPYVATNFGQGDSTPYNDLEQKPPVQMPKDFFPDSTTT